jgi:hypothetical protein
MDGALNPALLENAAVLKPPFSVMSYVVASPRTNDRI